MSKKVPKDTNTAPTAYNTNSAVPDSNTLLAYKLLQDSWGGAANVFDGMLKDEMKYLMAGISALNNDPYLAMRLGGNNLAVASQLAQIIKQREQQLDLEERINPIARAVLRQKYMNPAMQEMMPNRRKPVVVNTNGNNIGQLTFRAGKFNGSIPTSDYASRDPRGIRPNVQGATYATLDHQDRII